jgi:hypothetical protein
MDDGKPPQLSGRMSAGLAGGGYPNRKAGEHGATEGSGEIVISWSSLVAPARSKKSGAPPAVEFPGTAVPTPEWKSTGVVAARCL